MLSLVSYRHPVGYCRSPGNLASRVTRSIGECRMSLWSPWSSVCPWRPSRTTGCFRVRFTPSFELGVHSSEAIFRCPRVTADDAVCRSFWHGCGTRGPSASGNWPVSARPPQVCRAPIGPGPRPGPRRQPRSSVAHPQIPAHYLTFCEIISHHERIHGRLH